MQERIRTQLSSRYSPDNLTLFDFKRHLRASAVDATYPIGDDIIGYDQGFAITVEEEAHVPFYSSELRFLRQVKANPLHIVFNINGGHEGYIGESTSVETAYAMLLDRKSVV